MSKRGMCNLLIVALFMTCVLGMTGCGLNEAANTSQESTGNEIVTVNFSYSPYGYDS